MRLVCLLVGIIVSTSAMAAAPGTSCPSGYVAINETAMIVADGACPTGYRSVGDAVSCLLPTPAGVCMMFAPADTAYSDDTGVWRFEDICPLT